MFQMLLLLCVPQVGFCTCLNKGRQFGKHGYGTKSSLKTPQKVFQTCCMKQLAVLLVFTLTFIYLNMYGPNKNLQP